MNSEQKQARYEMIKAAAESIALKKKASLYRRAVLKLARKARGYGENKAEIMSDETLDKLDENHNRWTDEAKFAQQAVGETYRNTTKWDNEWN